GDQIWEIDYASGRQGTRNVGVKPQTSSLLTASHCRKHPGIHPCRAKKKPGKRRKKKEEACDLGRRSTVEAPVQISEFRLTIYDPSKFLSSHWLQDPNCS